MCLGSQMSFGRHRACRVPFSSFVLHGPILGGAPRTSGAILKFCAPWTRFGRHRGRRVLFSCFALPDPFSAVPRAPGPIFMFRSRTCFRRYRGRRVPFSSFALPESCSTVRRVLGPIFMFCAPGYILGGIERVRSLFRVLHSRTRFRRY
jgi:hypothetical protein